MKTSWNKKAVLGIGVAATLAAIFLMIPGVTIATTRVCADGTCPEEIKVADNGKTLTYQVDHHFSVVLDKRVYPPDELTCAGDNILEQTKNLPYLYPNQMQRFLVTNPGSCVFKDRDFSVTIVTIPEK